MQGCGRIVRVCPSWAHTHTHTPRRATSRHSTPRRSRARARGGRAPASAASTAHDRPQRSDSEAEQRGRCSPPNRRRRVSHRDRSLAPAGRGARPAVKAPLSRTFCGGQTLDVGRRKVRPPPLAGRSLRTAPTPGWCRASQGPAKTPRQCRWRPHTRRQTTSTRSRASEEGAQASHRCSSAFSAACSKGRPSAWPRPQPRAKARPWPRGLPRPYHSTAWGCAAPRVACGGSAPAGQRPGAHPPVAGSPPPPHSKGKGLRKRPPQPPPQ